MSSSSSSPRWIYDVFINFRGEDVRKNFVCHLYAELSKKGINTFLDDKKLHKGTKLGPELLRAIEGSHISIVVFSKNYTKSSWCLDELEEIMDRRTYGQVVIPIFYNVDPAVVRHQTGAFGKGLKSTVRRRYSNKGMQKEDLLSKWRSALTEAANLAGWDADKFRDEAQLVKEIVEDVLKKLDITLLSTTHFPVGLDSLTTLIAENTAVEQVPFSIFRSKSIGYISLCGYQGSSRDVFSSLIWSWMSPAMNSLPHIPTSGGISRLQLSVKNNNMGLGYLSTKLSNLSELRSVQVQFHSEVQLTWELRRFIFDLYNANFTKLETSHTSQISDLSLKTLLIGMGSYHMVIDTLERSISQGLEANGSGDSFLPGDNYPSWLAYKGEGPWVFFKVPEDSNCCMKGIALCVFYSSTSEKMAAECLTGVLIINYTKCTVQLHKRDTVMSYNDEDWQGVISNLGAGDNVGIFVAFGHAVTVKETAVYLIYNEPSPTPYEIFARLVRRVVECLCLN